MVSLHNASVASGDLCRPSVDNGPANSLNWTPYGDCVGPDSAYGQLVGHTSTVSFDSNFAGIDFPPFVPTSVPDSAITSNRPLPGALEHTRGGADTTHSVKPAEFTVTSTDKVVTSSSEHLQPQPSVTHRSEHLQHQSAVTHSSEHLQPQPSVAPGGEHLQQQPSETQNDSKITQGNTSSSELILTLQSSSRSLYVDVSLQGRAVRFLVDTGAERTLIDQHLYNSLLNVPPPQLNGLSLKTASGEIMENHGSVNLGLTVGFKNVTMTFIVTKLNGVSGILGIDALWDVLHGSLHFVNCRCLVFDGTQVPLHLEARPETLCARVCVSTSIPPFSSLFIQSNFPNSEKGDSVLFEPDREFLAEKGLQAPACVYDPSNDTRLFVSNLTSEPVELSSDDVMGNFSAVQHILEEQPEQQSELVASCNVCSVAGRPPSTQDHRELSEHLKCMTKDLDHLTPAERSEVHNLLVDYEDCFVGGQYGLGRTMLGEHTIETTCKQPIRIPARFMTQGKRQIVDKLVQELLDQDIVEESCSPWSSPIVLVTKKDNSHRLCCDYRSLNFHTVKDATPVPKITEMIDSLVGSEYFCCMDLASSYYQVPVHPKDRPKTAFSTGRQLFQFKVVPFGLTNAPACFVRVINRLLAGLAPEQALAYLDDVVIFGSTFEETKTRLCRVLDRFRQANLRLKPKKCKLFAKRVTYLGFEISNEGLRTDPEKVNKVLEWCRPTNITELRGFVGFCNYYRSFVPSFSHVVEPLVAMTRKGAHFSWSAECESAFRDLKRLMTEAPMLAYPDAAAQFVVDTDCSQYAMGGVLSQVVDGVERPIAFGSKLLNSAQRQYCATYRELLALITMVNMWKQYLFGQKFILRTDHSALKWLTSLKNCEGMLARWLASLAEYDMEIVHRPGRLHQNADALSRIRSCGRADCIECLRKEKQCKPEAQARVVIVTEALPTVSAEELRVKQGEDAVLEIVMGWVNTGVRPTWEEMVHTDVSTQTYWTQYKRLYMQDGILYRKAKLPSGDTVRQICLPPSLRGQVLDNLHTQGAHQGVIRTYEQLRRRFYWPFYQGDIQKWIAHCDKCARRGPKPPKHSKILSPPVPEPFWRIAVDLKGPLAETPRGYRYIMVVSDYCTKWTEAIPLHTKEASEVARQLLDVWICRWGSPTQIHSDGGREFENNLLKNLCSLLGVKKTKTTPYNPASDGLVESFNRNLGEMLSKLVDEEFRDDWDLHLQSVMMAYRATPHAATQYSPNYLLHGQENRLPIDLLYEELTADGDQPECVSQWVAWRWRALQRAFRVVKHNLKRAAERAERTCNKGCKDVSFVIGDWVWLYYKPLVDKSLSLRYIGPLQVVKVVNSVVYSVRSPTTGKCKAVHVNLLKPCRSSVAPGSDHLSSFPPDDELIHLDVENAEEQEAADSTMPASVPVDGDRLLGRPPAVEEDGLDSMLSPAVRQRRRPAYLDDYDVDISSLFVN